MLLLAHFLTGVLFFEYVCSLNVISNRRNNENTEEKQVLNQIIKGLKYLVKARRDGREFDESYLMKSKLLYDSLKKDISKPAVQQWLRIQQLPEVTTDHHEILPSPIKDEAAEAIVGELQHTFVKQSSALLDRPFVQNSGRQDYLVMQPGRLDRFVTVIPNDIYYNHEKTCVNWLEDCNAQGIRSKLLQKIRSPYT